MNSRISRKTIKIKDIYTYLVKNQVSVRVFIRCGGLNDA